MAKKIAISNLNGSTLDILNTIRANAPLEYQNTVPVANSVKEIPRVGEQIYGYPANANYFIEALVNRIALVRARSLVFNNPFSIFKKGYLEFGESVEEIFVNIAKVRAFNAEKAPAREFARTIPDVKSTFHIMNWRVQYPVTISDEELRMAFTSADGVSDMITRIIDSVYTAAEYDEYLLVKYLLIKGVTGGKMKPEAIDNNLTNNASAFRGISNIMTIPRTDYNSAGVLNNTPRERQYIIMDSKYNAEFDVNVLAAAFHMDKAEFLGKLLLVDDFTSFDNERWATIRSESDMVEEVTADELTLMAGVKAVLVDEEWFQIYDNLSRMTQTPVNSGLYWNYFYHNWKTVSTSPFSNAVVFATNNAVITAPIFKVASKVVDDNTGTTIVTLQLNSVTSDGVNDRDSYSFLQTEKFTVDGVGVHPYGAFLIPVDKNVLLTDIRVKIGGMVFNGDGPDDLLSLHVGDTANFN